MQKFLDSPLGNLLRILGDLLTLNLLFIFLSLPVITIGANLSAMYAVLLKLIHGEQVFVFRTFFKNWKSNFLKATALWLIFLLLVFVASVDFRFALTFDDATKSVFIIVATILVIIGLTIMTLGIIQLSKYENTLKNYIKNSFLLAACAPGWLILAWAVWVVLILGIYLFIEYVLTYGFVLLMWGISAPAMATAYFVDKIFAKVENAQANN
ncbi:MAG: DUF624 domain-containing protein [Ruminococcaceae bacterium]|nr:DUF624 domain-containing protein [Oscillospiraceae bacterium]